MSSYRTGKESQISLGFWCPEQDLVPLLCMSPTEWGRKTEKSKGKRRCLFEHLFIRVFIYRTFQWWLSASHWDWIWGQIRIRRPMFLSLWSTHPSPQQAEETSSLTNIRRDEGTGSAEVWGKSKSDSVAIYPFRPEDHWEKGVMGQENRKCSWRCFSERKRPQGSHKHNWSMVYLVVRLLVLPSKLAGEVEHPLPQVFLGPA